MDIQEKIDTLKLSDVIDLLGCKARCRVTGFQGIITSVSFDLYGCIQVVINPGVDNAGKLIDGAWFDLNRLTIIDVKAVMQHPFEAYLPQPSLLGFIEEAFYKKKKTRDKGPENKPLQKP